MANVNLANAKTAKNDEFYTQYADIQKEINAYLDYDPNVFRGKTVLLPCDDPEWSNFTKFFAQNFELLGLKKLISTSYAPESKKYKTPTQLTLFETEAPQFDAAKSQTHGKIFVLTEDITGDGRINIEDLQWQYLEGDGDFRSKEIRQLRDEADIIVTNPPFSLFREFLAWIMEAEKQFIIIGNMNAVTYKEIFPLIMSNKMWLGNGFHNGNAYFRIVNEREYADGVYDAETGLVKFRNCCWFSNIEHGRRHQPLRLMTMAENFKHSKHKELRERKEYIHYENYDAIDIPYTDAIPSDYEGIMGVPTSFLDKYCPEQFEILGITDRGNEYGIKTKEFTSKDTPLYGDLNRRGAIMVDGQLKSTFARILIRKKNGPMKAEDKNKEVDTEMGILTLEVGSEVIGKVRTGEITHLIAQINENNQNMILENNDGNLVLVIDELPATFHGCYLYNNGEFPFAIKDELDCILLTSAEEECFTRIISVDTEPGTRFNYQGAGKPIEEDPNGDSCIWKVYFEVVPVPEKSNTYLMRWNPSISSFTEKDFEECVTNMVHGMFRMNWSIFEWEEARRGDRFFMMRVGDDKAGIVFLGEFITDPYPADDWAGSTKRRMYVDMVCMNPVDSGTKPRITLEKLQNTIPEFEWSKGHSGELLPDDVLAKLEKLLLGEE